MIMRLNVIIEQLNNYILTRHILTYPKLTRWAPIPNCASKSLREAFESEISTEFLTFTGETGHGVGKPPLTNNPATDRAAVGWMGYDINGA
jgi:hypothetical protein